MVYGLCLALPHRFPSKAVGMLRGVPGACKAHRAGVQGAEPPCGPRAKAEGRLEKSSTGAARRSRTGAAHRAGVQGAEPPCGPRAEAEGPRRPEAHHPCASSTPRRA
jgi:hypothetical protein